MDIFLIIVTVVVFIILTVMGVYFLVYYQHPDDNNEAWLPKFVVLFGFILAGATVLLLPLDVANKEGYPGCAGYDTDFCGGINMEGLWSAIFYLIPIWVFMLIPFSTFYYEADDGMLMAGTAYAPNAVKKSRVAQACCNMIIVVIFVVILFTVTYVALSDTKVPVTLMQSAQIGTVNENDAIVRDVVPIPNVTEYNVTDTTTNETITVRNASGFLPFSIAQLEPTDPRDSTFIDLVQTKGEQEIVLQVSPGTFYGALMSLMGWVLFALFGGIGLASVPLDLILTFVNRPRHLDPAEYAELKVALQQRTNELVDIGELLKVDREEKARSGTTASRFSLNSESRRIAREERQAFLGFKQAVYLLDQDVEDFMAVSANYENYNPLIPYAALIVGCCSVFISLFWFLHICIYVFPDPPLVPFLNNFFQWFDLWFPLFGVLSVALFTVYLLLCAVKGCFKFGLRFLFFHIHPMKPGKTYMSSFMFNIALVLMCSLPVVQLCQQAFSQYAAYANVQQIFGVQIQYLELTSWAYETNLFIYIFVIIAGLTTLYLCCKPKDEAASGQALRDRLNARTTSSDE